MVYWPFNVVSLGNKARPREGTESIRAQQLDLDLDLDLDLASVYRLAFVAYRKIIRYSVAMVDQQQRCLKNNRNRSLALTDRITLLRMLWRHGCRHRHLLYCLLRKRGRRWLPCLGPHWLPPAAAATREEDTGGALCCILSLDEIIVGCYYVASHVDEFVLRLAIHVFVSIVVTQAKDTLGLRRVAVCHFEPL